MRRFILSLLVMTAMTNSSWSQPRVSFEQKPQEQRVDVLVKGELFTSYIYDEEIKKPVLWPVIGPGGQEVTRGFPLKSRAGERVDHPHHVGVWLNYGDVNGLDFWNNSNTIAAGKASGYGTIHHESVEWSEGGKGIGRLYVKASWRNSADDLLLEETSEYTFRADKTVRIIDRTTILKSVNDAVRMTDNKEGMFAIRVARALELPVRGKLKLTDSHGQVTEVDAADDRAVTGNYLSSEGITGDAVWATRGRWMKLSGVVDGEPVALVIFDHPANAGYPTYWHARGYGLFAANTLGKKVFSEGQEEMNFIIGKDQVATFRYRLAIFSGDPDPATIDAMAEEFSNCL